MTKRTLVTSVPWTDASGAPLSGVKVVCELDRDGVEGASFIAKSTVTFILDAAGQLPAGSSLWVNSLDPAGPRWLISLRQGSGKDERVLQKPVAVTIPAGAGAIELLTLLQDSYSYPPVRL